MAEALYHGNINNNYPVARSVAYAWFVALSLRQMHTQLADMQVYDVLREKMFLISFSMLLYFSVSLLFILFKPTYMALSIELTLKVFRLTWILSILSRITLAAGIWIKPRKY
jgi:hypothetical protein